MTGPAEYTYKEVVEFVSDVTTVKKPLVNAPEFVAGLAGRFLNQTIAPVFTEETLIQLQADNVASSDPGFVRLADLGIEGASMDKVAFDYLHRFRPGGHFTTVQGYY